MSSFGSEVGVYAGSGVSCAVAAIAGLCISEPEVWCPRLRRIFVVTSMATLAVLPTLALSHILSEPRQEEKEEKEEKNDEKKTTAQVVVITRALAHLMSALRLHLMLRGSYVPVLFRISIYTMLLNSTLALQLSLASFIAMHCGRRMKFNLRLPLFVAMCSPCALLGGIFARLTHGLPEAGAFVGHLFDLLCNCSGYVHAHSHHEVISIGTGTASIKWAQLLHERPIPGTSILLDGICSRIRSCDIVRVIRQKTHCRTVYCLVPALDMAKLQEWANETGRIVAGTCEHIKQNALLSDVRWQMAIPQSATPYLDLFPCVILPGTALLGMVWQAIMQN